MATQTLNIPAATKMSILDEAKQLVAEHPHFVGLSVGAVAAALSHFYYDNAILTSVGMFVAGLVAGEIISRVVASAREIEAAAKSGKAALENLAAAGSAAEDAKARALALEQELISAKALIAAMGAEALALRQEFAAEAKAQAAFRQWTLDETAKAQAFAAEAQAQLKAAIEAKADEPAPVVEVVTPPAETPAKAKPSKAA